MPHLLDLNLVVLLVGRLLVAVVVLVLPLLAVLKAVADVLIKVRIRAHVVNDLVDTMWLHASVVVIRAFI